MEKYGVQVDPKKLEQEKIANKGGKKEDKTTNVPLDPKKGTEPYETDPEGDDGKE